MKETMSCMLDQVISVLEGLKKIFPDTPEFLEMEHSWESAEVAEFFSSSVTQICAYAMGMTWLHSSLNFTTEETLYFTMLNPYGSAYPPYQSPDASIELITAAWKKARRTPYDATSMINGWNKIAEDHQVTVRGQDLSPDEVKNFLDRLGIFEQGYAQIYSNPGWQIYQITVGGCSKEIRMLAQPLSDGTHTIQVLFNMERE